MKTKLTMKTVKFVESAIELADDTCHGKLNSKASVKDINKQFAAARKDKRHVAE